MTWPELQAKGHPEGFPRIVLHSENSAPAATAPRAVLHLDCQRFNGNVQLELYITRVVPFPIPPPHPGDVLPEIRVAYSVDGEWRSESTWHPGEWSVDIEAAFAPQAQASDIIASLKNSAQRLEFAVNWPSDSEDATTYQFLTGGFEKAFEPLSSVCG